ncbi:hypothetical protein OHB41_47860 [Streptomyces sp. NBC_01571]|uniref:hypothetical protein n=1 Tax=Streptomyces sp. NBC_01571 TaxID=2975883 RepID=UPI00225124E0|nr:hypothetical protein [Streptomyces sp. NBC_01571]MCX4580709.1 hypothetical protein [Streptomyces sp. NBC_01571]
MAVGSRVQRPPQLPRSHPHRVRERRHRPRRPIPDHIKDGQFEISGLVKTGADERERGTRRAAPLRIDASRGDRSDIEVLWLAGDLRDDDFEDRFIDDIIVADIGEGTDGWEFSGGSYTVELR